MQGAVKVAIVLMGVTAAGAAVGGKYYWKSLVARAEADQADASRSLMQSEELVWTLEGECLADAQRILAMRDARDIAFAKEIAPSAADSPAERARVEARLRQFLRIRRSPKVKAATERAFLTMTNESRSATNDAAMKSGLRPVDILSEWMTFEGASDLALMTSVHNDRAALRSSAGPIVDTFFSENAPAPSAAKGVKVLERQDSRIVIDLFGARVVEECVPGQRVEMSLDGNAAKVPWRSNYNYLRDLVRKKKPEEILVETLVRTDEGFGVEYRDWIGEYTAGGDKVPWATVLCRDGPLAVGALKVEEGDAKPETPEKGEKREKPAKPEHE